MEEKRMVIIGVGAVLVIMTVTLLAVTQSANDDTGGVEPEQLNRTNPLLLISLDGFRSDYMYRNLPTLETMARNGVRARFMMPSYPTLTFPNHYSIVTGMYPEAHGIVANSFYDPDINQTFSMSNKEGKWWGGEPIWNTLTLQNKTSATYFWPGSDCDIGGLYPTHYYVFNDTFKNTPFADRVDQVLEWLSQPEEERPDLVTLYFQEPDETGHNKGPDTRDMDLVLAEMDGLISRLLSGLRARALEDKVNIIVLADHGMARSNRDRVLNLTEYLPDIANLSSHNYYGPFTTLRLKDSSEAKNVLTHLACPAGTPTMRAYAPQDLPKRFHYSYSKRIGDIVLDLDSGYFVYDLDNPSYYNKSHLGDHGYDNHLTSMGALFIATGPDFKKNVTLEPFQNIELYNLMCYLTGVEPAPNNGTEGALYGALLDEPFVPELPAEDHPLVPTFPELNNETLQMAQCPGDLYQEEDLTWLQDINITEAEQQQLVELHLPWGIPLSGNLSDSLLLHHKDHVTGYSEKLKMPLWTSFTVTNPVGSQMNSSLWSSDVRLSANNTASCESYTNLTAEGRDVTMFPLFHPIFSIDPDAIEIPYLVSNAVPLVIPDKTVDTLTLLADTWRVASDPFNLVIGLAFDYDADSLPDDTTNASIPAVPSHIFIVATHCSQLVNSLNECKQEDLDAKSFILPQFQTVNNDCLTGTKYASFHLATVRDVELLTGLTFFPALDPEVRLQLALRIHSNIWRTTTT